MGQQFFAPHSGNPPNSVELELTTSTACSTKKLTERVMKQVAWALAWRRSAMAGSPLHLRQGGNRGVGFPASPSTGSGQALDTALEGLLGMKKFFYFPHPEQPQKVERD